MGGLQEQPVQGFIKVYKKGVATNDAFMFNFPFDSSSLGTLTEDSTHQNGVSINEHSWTNAPFLALMPVCCFLGRVSFSLALSLSLSLSPPLDPSLFLCLP